MSVPQSITFLGGAPPREHRWSCDLPKWNAFCAKVACAIRSPKRFRPLPARLKTNAALVIPLRTDGRTCLAPSKRPWRTCPSTATGSRGFARPACKKYSDDDCVFAGMLLRQALFVLRQLPQPAVPLAELATRTTGDSHALDAGK